MHPVVDDSYEFVDQNSSDISCKEIVSCNRPTYHHDEFKLQRYGEREKKGSDQKLSLHFLLKEVEQSTFSINISEGKYQQHKEVFPVGFYDPIANYLESMNNIDVKIFLLDESYIYHLFKPLSCSMYIPFFLGLRSRSGSIDHFLAWLHWKHEFT